MKQTLLFYWQIILPVILLTTALSSSGSPQDKVKLTIVGKSMNIEDVFNSIKKQTGLTVFYSNDVLNDEEKLKANFNNKELSDVLNIILKGKDVNWIIQDGFIILKKNKGNYSLNQPETKISTQKIQDILVSGSVVDGKNQPLIGVSVRLKGTSIGISTDNNGRFSINVPEASGILVFSYLGFISQEVAINGRAAVDVKMVEDVSALNEVVVVGYGTQKKTDITGSVASVSQDRIKDLPVSGIDQALKGQVAGMNITQNTGSPGGGVTVRIRGNNSITAGNNPLYVIDGFPVSGGGRGTDGVPGAGNPLNTINPSDIESVDVLKDASATAIYGSRGANGVIIITTKTGKAGKGKLTFDNYTSIQNASKRLDVLDAEEFVELHIESRNNGWLRSGGNPNTPNSGRGRFSVSPIYFDPSQWRRTEWQDQVLTTGIIQNYNLGTTGGNENIRYALSANYLKNEGIIVNSALQRYSFRANIDAKINEKVNVGLRITPSYTINPGVRSDGHFSSGGVLGLALRMPPLISPYLPDGRYENPLALRTATTLGSIGAIDNPVAKLNEDQYDLDQGRILSNIFAEYKILDNLQFKSSLGVNGNFNRVHTFLSSKTGRAGSPPPSVPSGTASSSQDIEWLNENLLTYETAINEKNRITAIGGFSIQKNDYKFIQVAGNNYPNDNVQYVAAAGIIESGTELRNQSSLLSYYGRINYAFDDRYLITATLRRDGSSRFGEENKYGTFPSAAFAWRMSEENFIKKIPFISNLKWRLSYGISGNNSIPNYAYVPNVVTNGYVIGTGQTVVNGVNAGRLANPFITWETMRSINLGLDLGILKNRLEFTIDAYKSNTDGLLLDVNIPAISGFGTSLENIGEVENRGLEIAVNSRNLINNLKWNTGFNISFNKNKVIALGGSAGDFIDVGDYSRTAVGRPLGLFYTRVTDGVFNSVEEVKNHVPQDNSPQPGDRRFKDVNNDGKIDNNDLDFTGNPNPDFIFGFTNNFSFKGFELNVLLNGSYGNDIYYQHSAALNLNGNVNNIELAKNRWRSAETPGSGNIPKAVFGFTTLSDVGSDFYVMDGSFLRLTNITLAYNIPKTLINKISLQNARVYVGGQNMFTVSKYPGYDPETGSGGNNPLVQGVDNGIYPMARAFTLGLNITL